MKSTLGVLKSSFAIAMLTAIGLGTVPANAADSAAAGRKHAAKANQLAAKNKCKSAVVEFTKAYKSAKDPTILFNRAECYRKMGSTTDALKDYEQFLADMPEAPNRSSVEARIATLRGAAPPSSPTPPQQLPPATPRQLPPVVPKQPSLVAPQQPLPAPPPSSAVEAKQPAPGSANHTDQAPVPPVHRAEKWTD
jgi:tetratricopeptide (TPR) repeat protein